MIACRFLEAIFHSELDHEMMAYSLRTLALKVLEFGFITAFFGLLITVHRSHVPI